MKTLDFNFSHKIETISKLIWLIWLQYLILDELYRLHHLPYETFYPRGIFRFIINEQTYNLLTNFNLLFLFQIALILILIIRMKTSSLRLEFIFLVLVYFYELFKKGFGGHIDHRIATLLIFSVLFFVIKLDNSASVKVVLSIPYAFFFLQYSLIGIARLFNGFPELFFSEIFYKWLIQRNMRPKYYEYDLNTYLVNIDINLINILFLAATCLEIFAIFCLFLKRNYLKSYLIMLVLFHVGIFILMGISFLENILIILLLLYLTNEKSNL